MPLMIAQKKLLIDKKEEVEKLANALLEKEVLFQSDVEALIGKRPYEEKKGDCSRGSSSCRGNFTCNSSSYINYRTGE